jgi:hypothetical protein
MVTLQLAKARPHRRRSGAERGRRRSFCLARNGPEGQGKKIGGNLCGRDDSCDQHVMQLRQREKCVGREGNWVNCKQSSCGGGVFSVFLHRFGPGRVRAFPAPGSRAATAGFRGNAMCVVWRNSMETVEASTTCPDHRDFERTLFGSPIAWICTARPSPALCQLRPVRSCGRRTSFATHDRGVELRVRQSEDQHWRDARYEITDVTRPPQRPLPNGRDEALPRPCDGWSGWLRGDGTASGTSQGEAAFQLGEGGCVQPTE